MKAPPFSGKTYGLIVLFGILGAAALIFLLWNNSHESLKADLSASTPLVFQALQDQPFIPTVSEPRRILPIPATPNVAYGKVSVDLDVTQGGWTQSPAAFPTYDSPQGLHNIFWLHRGPTYEQNGWHWNNNVIGYASARGPNSNSIRLSSNLDPTTTVLYTQEKGLALQQGHTYHFHYVYDGENNQRTLQVLENNQEILNISGNAEINTILSQSPGFFLSLGNRIDIDGPEEAPTLGWKYANVRVE